MTTAMWQPELPFTTASPSASQESVKDSRELPDSCSSTFERYVNSVHVGLSGRTSQERSQASGGRLIASSCQRWMRSGMVWHGEYWMRSFSVWPKDANVVVDERDKVFLCQTAQTGSNGKLVKQDDVMNTLDRTNSTAVAALDFNPTDARLRYAHDDVSQTLTARAGTGGNQVPLVQVQPVAFLYNQGSKARSLGLGEISPTLKTDHNPVVAFAQNQCDDSREQGDVAGALVVRQGAKQQTYIFRADGQTNAMAGVNLAPTLTSHAKKDPPIIYPAEDSTGEDEPVTLQIRGGKPGGGKSALIQHDMSATLSTHNTRTLITGDNEERGLTVRRLTPRECERLQGFPDDYTDIPYRNKEHAPDGARYRALGNSMAVPVMRWIGERIQMVEEAAETTE